MDQERWAQIKSILNEALDLPVAERKAGVSGLCAGDEALEAEVLALLVQDDEADLVIDQPAISFGGRPLDRIGPYRIERELGHGGMGSVFLAVREDDECGTRVALKVLKRGMDTDDFVKRFRNERDILANLGHPNIAQLREGGSTRDGLPYFVMEYIEGQPIDQWCDQRSLSIKERLALFIQVCEAVHFAHRNLIVHRDLKPSNILVTEDGVPKLLDFGIAKLLQKDFDVTATATHQRVMTPGYAAPEQVRGQTLTTACDIYTLGVLLYELLTGRRPYSVSDTSPAEMERIICEIMPGKPSTMVLRLDGDATGRDKMTAPAGCRGLEPKRLSRLLRGDLDNIVLLAMRKEPERRYDTALLFAEDLRRYLDGFPVKAHTETWTYLLGKFVKRNRQAVAAAALMVLVLSGAMGVLIQKNRQVADEKNRSQKISGLVLELFNALDPYSSSQDSREGVLLEKIQAKVREEFAEDSRDKAQFLETIGKVYLRRGKLETSKPLLDEALALRIKLDGASSAVTADTRFLLAEWFERVGSFKEARDLYEQVYDYRLGALGEADPDTAVARIRFGASSYFVAGSKAAGPLLEAGIATLENHPDYVTELANGLKYQGLIVGVMDPDAGEVLLRRALELQKEIFGEDHAEVADTLATLGDQYRRTFRLVEGLEVMTEAIDILERVLGEQHPSLWDPLITLGYIHTYAGRPHQAVPVLTRALNLKRSAYSKDDGVLVSGLYALASAQVDAEMYKEAVTDLNRVIQLARERFGPNSNIEANAHTLLGYAYMFLGDSVKAEGYLDQALGMTADNDPTRNPAHLEALGNQAVNLAMAGRMARLPGMVDELARAVADPKSRQTYWQFQFLYAKARLAEHRNDPVLAEATLKTWCEQSTALFGEYLYVSWAYTETAAFYHRQNRLQDADQMIDRALTIRAKYPDSLRNQVTERLKGEIRADMASGQKTGS